MNGHVDDVDQAFNIIHEERRRLKRENTEWRTKYNQQTAVAELLRQELADAKRQMAQLRGHCLRNGAILLNAAQACGTYITNLVSVTFEKDAG